ncbi:MAG: hypothetical protein JWO63_3245 [Frankiales bacterium]|nr:hypothetical protein [Frankiales bacterium]
MSTSVPTGESSADAPARNRLRSWHVLLLVFVLMALVAGALVRGFGVSGAAVSTRVGGIDAKPDYVAGSEAAATSTPDLAAVRQLLSAHGSALRARDQDSWQAALDQAPAAAGYRTAQQNLFHNIAAVPLSAWSYTVAGALTDRSVIDQAALRLGGVVLVLHVRLNYALAAVDPAPTSKDLWLTAVRRGASWKLAGDTDATALGDTSWRGLWDFGPVIAARTAHTLVLGHPAHAAELSADAALVERAIPVVTSVWGPDWNDHVALLIPDTAPEFAAVTGDSGDVSQLAALSVADRVRTGVPSAAQAVLGARIVLNPTNLHQLDGPARQLVVQHELTHLAARSVTDDAMPIWVIEGFADYVGNLGSGRTAAESAPDLALDVRHGQLPSQLPTAADFDGANPELSQVYEESALACSEIASQAGTAGLVGFYRAVAAEARIDPATATQAGLAAILHSDVASFTQAWRRYLSAQLR